MFFLDKRPLWLFLGCTWIIATSRGAFFWLRWIRYSTISFCFNKRSRDLFADKFGKTLEMGASRCHRAKDSPSLGIEPVRWQDLMNSNRGLATAGLQVEMHTIGSLAELCWLVSYFLLCSCCTHVISLHPPHSTVSPSTLCDFSHCKWGNWGTDRSGEPTDSSWYVVEKRFNLRHSGSTAWAPKHWYFAFLEFPEIKVISGHSNTALCWPGYLWVRQGSLYTCAFPTKRNLHTFALCLFSFPRSWIQMSPFCFLIYRGAQHSGFLELLPVSEWGSVLSHTPLSYSSFRLALENKCVLIFMKKFHFKKCLLCSRGKKIPMLENIVLFI